MTVDDRPARLLSPHALIEAGLLSSGDRGWLEAVAEQFAIALTPAVAAAIEGPPDTDPVAAQFVPRAAELTVLPEELEDPIGDSAHSPVTGIVHRYPDRLLLMPLSVCPVYCRFCFRRETVGQSGSGAVLSQAALDAALDYVRATPSVWEVILSGGDPLLLSPARLARMLRALEAIAHVRVLRIHTRVPVVDPQRIDEALLRALQTDRALYVAVHANHPQEFSAAATQACARLAAAGIPLLSQSVLLRGVNDDVSTLERLMRAFVERRIKPYYLHHGDLAKGTSHFRVGLERGRALVEALQGRVSGLCQPTYVLDLPGGHGKVPVTPSWVERVEADRWHLRDYRGRVHVVRDAGSGA